MEELAAFIRQFPVRQFTKDEMLVYESDSSTEFFAIRSGLVKASSILEDGTEQLVWLAGKHDLVPLEQLFGARPSQTSFFYTAYSDGEAYVIPKNRFRVFLQCHPKSMNYAAKELTNHMYDLLERLNGLGKPKAKDKIMQTLLFLCHRFGSANTAEGNCQLDLELTQQDIANLVGVTRETAAVELKRLKDEGQINYGPGYFTVCPSKLSAAFM